MLTLSPLNTFTTIGSRMADSSAISASKSLVVQVSTPFTSRWARPINVGKVTDW
jgi:hypothetical protein